MMTTKTLESSQPDLSLPSSPLSSSYLTLSGLRLSKSPSIFEKLENGKYKDHIVTANDAITIPSSVSGTSRTNPESNSCEWQKTVVKTPMHWSPEVLSIKSPKKWELLESLKDYKFTGDESVLQKLEKQSFRNKDRIKKALKFSIQEYDKYLILCKKQEWLKSQPDDPKNAKFIDKFNGESIYMELQIREIQIIKYEIIIKMFDYYHDVLIIDYEHYDDCYNTDGERREFEKVLIDSFNQFYDYLLQIEYLEREENKMIYLLQNKKSMKIIKDGYLRYYWDRVINRI